MGAVRKWLFLRAGVRIKKWNVPIHETEDLVLFHLEENHVLTGFSKSIMMSLSSHLGHVTVYASFFFLRTGMFNKDAFSKMKSNAVFVNTSR